MDLVPTILVIIVAAFIAGAIAYRLGQPLILGFVVAGIALGPYTGGITVTEIIDAQLLSQIGAALLLFALGLEFSLNTVRPVSSLFLFGVPVQLALTFLFGYLVGQLLGWQALPSFWFGALIVLSSPLVTLHTLAGLQINETNAARLSRSIIIVQNLIVVSLVFVMRQIQLGNTGLPALALAAAEGVLFLAVLLLTGTHILPRIYALIARQTNRELSLIVVIASVALIIYGIYLYGLTFIEVAFVIGLILSESDLGSRALKAMMSMRALFGVLFFVSAGMLLDLTFLGANIVLILALVALVTVGKIAIIGGITRLLGHSNNDALTVGLTLFQLSELSFVLALLALNSGAIDDDLYSVIIIIGLITMLLTPYFGRLLQRRISRMEQQSLPLSPT